MLFRMDGFVTTWAIVFVSLVMLAIVPADATPIKAAGKGFWDTHMRLCDVDANGHCHTKDYALSISRFGSGGAAVAILILLVLLAFVPIRFLCNGCGGRNPSYGICPSNSEKRYYKRDEILSVKLAVIALIIPIVIAVGIGFQANSEISSSVNNITTSLQNSGDQILQSLTQTREVVLQFTSDAQAKSVLDSAVSTATTVDKNLREVHQKGDKYDNIREAIMIVGFVCSVAMVIAGIICAIFNLRVIAMILAIFALIGLIIVWICFGIHLVADKFVFDVCVDIDILTSNNTAVVASTTSLFKTGALAKLWACDNNTELVQLENLVDTSITQAATSACDLRSQVCFNKTSNSGDPDFTCAPTPQCNRDTLLIVTDAQHMQVLDDGQERSLSECAVSCSNAQYRNASALIVSSLALYANYTNIYQNTILPILNCQIAQQVLLKVKPALCTKMFNSLYGVAITSLIVGIFFIPFVILMVVGFKRFQSLDGGLV
eukprot:Phypoly_transcript_06592.p1 GENE.Phypoly_transcript_06592~~Phypoly_transcript_06592.p1  ORF type:complete len:490 (+),score=70.79 Phypoly_transcript_06592:171-1640(+)